MRNLRHFFSIHLAIKRRQNDDQSLVETIFNHRLEPMPISDLTTRPDLSCSAVRQTLPVIKFGRRFPRFGGHSCAPIYINVT